MRKNLKTGLTVLFLILFSLVQFGCSAIEQITNSAIEDQMSKNSSSGGGNGSGGSGGSGGAGGGQFVVSANMVNLMFPVFYYGYFTWGGVYDENSLKPGEWAVYEYSHKGEENSGKAYITKAFLEQKGTQKLFRLKLENQQQEWMSLDFAVDNNQVKTVVYRTKDESSKEIQLSSPMTVERADEKMSNQIRYNKLPRKTVKVPAGTFSAYIYDMKIKDKEDGDTIINIYVSRKVPGYLVKYEITNKQGKNEMTLIKYGKNARQELK
jgi:hypothetical protein